jgi:hypothetical protein
MKGLDILSRVMGQITSGRWLITIASAWCFILLTRTLCSLMEQGKITLEASTYVAIVMSILNTVGMVTVFYFQKQRPDINGNGDSETITTTTLPPTK